MTNRKTYIIFGHMVRYVGPLLLASSVLSFGGLDNLGKFSLAMAVVAPLFIVASLGLRGQVLASRDFKSFTPLLFLRVFALVAATGIGSLICLYFLPEIGEGIWCGVLAFKFAESLLDLGTAWKQKSDQNLQSLIQSTLGILSLSIGIVISLVLHEENLMVFFAGISMLSYAIFVVTSIQLMNEKSHFRDFEFKKVVSSGLTLGLSFALVSLSASIPQMALAKTHGFGVNGLFSLLGYFILLSEVFANPLAQIWLQNQAGNNEQNPLELGRTPWIQLFRKVAWVAIPASCILPIGWFILSKLEKLPNLSLTTFLIVVSTMVAVHAFQFAGAFAQVNGLHVRWLIGSIVTTGFAWLLVFILGDSITLDWALAINLLVLITRTVSLANRQPRNLAEQPIESYVVILGSANGSKNLGDQAMFDALVEAVRTEYPGMRIVTDSFQSNWKPEQEGITHIPPLSSSLRVSTKFFMSKTHLISLLESFINKAFFTWALKLRALSAQAKPHGLSQRTWHGIITGAEFVLISGAGAINSRYATHGIYSWGILSKWAKKANRRVLLFGQGLGPFSRSDFRFAANWLKSVDYLGVRDRKSFDLGRKIGILNLELKPDWATFFTPTKDDLTYSQNLWKKMGKPRISLTLHRTSRTFSEGHYIRLVTEAAQVAIDARTRVLLLPNMYGGRSNHDGEFMKTLIAKIPHDLRSVFICIDDEFTYQQTMAILGLVEFAITSRYHTAIFASMNSTPSLGVAIDSYWAGKLQAAQEMLDCKVLVQKISEPMNSKAIKKSLGSPISARSLRNFRKPLIQSLKKALENG